MPSSSVRAPAKRRAQTLRAMSEFQLKAYFLARETLRRMKGVTPPLAEERARQHDPP